MRAKVTITREEGRLRVPIGAARMLEGSLQLTHVQLPYEERTVAVLEVLGDRKGRKLYEPKLSRLGAGTIVFTGLECIDRAWYAQEWSCDFEY